MQVKLTYGINGLKEHFHIMVDLHDKDLQKDVVQVISTMSLDSICIDFSPNPCKGYFTYVPCDLYLFSLDETSPYNLTQYQRLQKRVYPEAQYIFFGKKFYFFEKAEVLEIPRKKFIKYLTRCLLNQYLEFNKKKITEELKKIRDWNFKK